MIRVSPLLSGSLSLAEGKICVRNDYNNDNEYYTYCAGNMMAIMYENHINSIILKCFYHSYIWRKV